jgi:XTP/dITP diphosphohydrolase
MKRFVGDRLIVATHNQGKLEEISKLLEPFGIALTSAGELGLAEPRETETTFAGNARIKAHFAAKASGLPALADDSGLAVEALDGAPGVYTADWAETPQGRDFPMAMEKVWTALEAAQAPFPRRAKFCCTLVLAWPDGSDAVFAGEMAGQIVWPMRGTQGHGYDPIFQPDGFAQTFGEMDRWQKNEISHRADAFAKLIAGCFS